MKRKPDFMSAIGMILGFGLVVFGIILNKDLDTGAYSIGFVNLKNFFDLPSIVIVVGGVIAVLMIMFPLSQFKKIPKHLAIIFSPKQFKPENYISQIVECAKKARINGLLALEEDADKMDDSFMKNSFQLIVDSVDPDKVKEQMESWLDNLDERHAADRALYDKGAQLGPAFGMIGTLIGLINMLKSLSDVESLGPNMAVALVTTFYGSMLANVLFAPISNKLKVRHEEEYLCMRIVSEGVQSIQAGENPKLIQEKLVHMLPEYQQKKFAKTHGNVENDDNSSSKK